MRKTHYLIVGILSLISISTHAIDSQKIAAKHPIIADKPVPGFFEGALLGNSALGVVVTTRPDAICLHFGHNNVWDIRIAEKREDRYFRRNFHQGPNNSHRLTLYLSQ